MVKVISSKNFHIGHLAEFQDQRKHILNFGNIVERLRYSPDEYELDYLRVYGKVYGTFRGVLPTLNVANAAAAETNHDQRLPLVCKQDQVSHL